MRVAVVAIMMGALIGAVPVEAGAAPTGPGWTSPNPAVHPGARSGASMTYDAARKETVLFGGDGTGYQVLGDTWIWDGHSWTERHPAVSPPVRTDAAMAYDPVHRNVVMFGGDDESGIYERQDTWVWDGVTWTQRLPAHIPPPRTIAGLAFDAVSGKVLMFGGGQDQGFLGDTWAWDGTDWQELLPLTSPTARAGVAMQTDPSGHVMLFGGQFSPSPEGTRNPWDFYEPSAETWLWTGTDWKKYTGPGPSARYGAASAALPDGVIVFGGSNFYGASVSDVWWWRNGAWSRQIVSSPLPARGDVTAAADRLGHVVRFGGYTFEPHGDTWVFSPEVDRPSAPLSADIETVLTAPHSVVSGLPFTIKITVLNKGPTFAGQTTTRIFLPPSLVVVDTHDGVQSGLSVTHVWTYMLLRAKQTYYLTMKSVPGYHGTAHIGVASRSITADPFVGNNNAAAFITIK